MKEKPVHEKVKETDDKKVVGIMNTARSITIQSPKYLFLIYLFK